jgi:hypothetical protein
MNCGVCHSPITADKPGYVACKECGTFRWVALKA